MDFVPSCHIRIQYYSSMDKEYTRHHEWSLENRDQSLYKYWTHQHSDHMLFNYEKYMLFKISQSKPAWWCTSVIPALRGRDRRFTISLGYTVNSRPAKVTEETMSQESQNKQERNQTTQQFCPRAGTKQDKDHTKP